MDKTTSTLLKALITTWIVVGVFSCFLMYKGWQSSKPLHDLVATLPQLTADTHDILVHVNRPCKGPASPDACGTLAQINKMSIAYSDMAHTASIQVAQTGELVTATTRNLDKIGDDVSRSVGHMNDLTDSLKASADDSQKLIGSIDAKVQSADVKSLLDNVNGAVTDGRKSILLTNGLIGDKNVPVIISNFAGMTTTLNHSLFTFDAVETKATFNYLHPSTNPLKRTWQVVSPFLLPAAQGTAAGLTLVAK